MQESQSQSDFKLPIIEYHNQHRLPIRMDPSYRLKHTNPIRVNYQRFMDRRSVDENRMKLITVKCYFFELSKLFDTQILVRYLVKFAQINKYTYIESNQFESRNKELMEKQKKEKKPKLKFFSLDENNSSNCDLSELKDSYFCPFTAEEFDEYIFSMRFILYAPKLFQHFTTLDNIALEAFDQAKNHNKVDQFTSTDGLKSGEYFYFSFNNGLIIKIMRQSEAHTFKKRLLNFATYLVNKPQSLLAKIYGLYTFERQQSKAKIHFLIMKNISLGIPRNLILRTYDLKGSEYDREVLTKKQESYLSKMTLKDTYFLKIEQQVWIDEQKKLLLNQTLSLDCEFLEQQKLIDYSPLKQQEQQILQFLDYQQLNIIPSIKENGVYYHFVITDYLQQWNVNKALERKTKKIINKNLQLDTSAQEPHKYGKRFKEKLMNKILPI